MISGEVSSVTAVVLTALVAAMKVLKDWHIGIRKLAASERKKVASQKSISVSQPSQYTAARVQPRGRDKLKIALLITNSFCMVLGYCILLWYFLGAPSAVTTRDLGIVGMAVGLFVGGMVGRS